MAGFNAQIKLCLDIKNIFKPFLRQNLGSKSGLETTKGQK